jgi:hypothetical protein
MRIKLSSTCAGTAILAIALGAGNSDAADDALRPLSGLRPLLWHRQPRGPRELHVRLASVNEGGNIMRRSEKEFSTCKPVER